MTQSCQWVLGKENSTGVDPTQHFPTKVPKVGQQTKDLCLSYCSNNKDEKQQRFDTHKKCLEDKAARAAKRNQARKSLMEISLRDN